jgi:hypothetical protein
MSGFGAMDQMVKSYRGNRELLREGKKSLKTIYQENNYFYIKKKINTKTKTFDPEQELIFLKKFYAKKKARTRKTFLFIFVVIIF